MNGFAEYRGTKERGINTIPKVGKGALLRGRKVGGREQKGLNKAVNPLKDMGVMKVSPSSGIRL